MKAASWNALPPIVRVLLPPLLLAAAFMLSNGLTAPQAADGPAITPIPATKTAVPVQMTPTPIQTAIANQNRPTATPSPTVTLTPVPLPAGAQITLLGPPSGSDFALLDEVSFYWAWPLPLQEKEQFALYITAGGKERLVGTIDEPNIGSSYRLSRTLIGLVNQDTLYEWQVRLERTDVANALIESEWRQLSILN